MIPHEYILFLSTTSKPRASGDDPDAVMRPEGEKKVNPARAGMIPTVAAKEALFSGKPRASGDDPYNREMGMTLTR